MKKYKCVCCGNFTLSTEQHGIYEICPVCFWEDDTIQFDYPEYEGGANGISLIRARENYTKFGAISENYLSKVRKPTEDEIPELNI